MNSLFSVVLLSVQALASNNLCEGVPSPGDHILQTEDRYMRVELICLDGKPKERIRYFKSTGSVSQRLIFTAGQPSEVYIFNNSNELTSINRYEYPPNGNIIRTIFRVKDGREDGVRDREELTGFDPLLTDVQVNAFTLRKWFFNKKLETDYIAHYQPGDSKRIRVKDYFDAVGKVKSRIYFSYQEGAEKPFRFVERDASGKMLTAYTLYEPFKPEKSLRKAGLTAAEIKRRLDHQRRPDRFLLAVIDGGFDYNHPDLAWKWWSNPTDPVDGIDNDGNGWIDDQFGWDREKESNLPTESSTNMTTFSRPTSHGTHVAHIATRGLEGVALIGYGGDYTRGSYVDQISAHIRQHKIKIVNLSLGLPKDNKNDLGLRDGIIAMEKMVRNNPETLFVVAAGNDGKNIDLFDNKAYPAGTIAPNIIKVGSLNTDRLDPSHQNDYQKASWSNFGKQTVDILAPGEDVSAAQLGGGYVKFSGTSMASPYMAREAAILWMKFPSLTAAQVREIFVRSARPMNPPPEVVSGGMVDAIAAEKLARELTR